MTVLKPVSVDILMPLMASSLDAAAAPLASAQDTATSFMMRFADHDAVGAVHVLGDATSADMAKLVGDVNTVATSMKAVHQVLRASGHSTDTYLDQTIRRIADGADRLTKLPTTTPRNLYMAAVSADGTALAMQRTLGSLREAVQQASERTAAAVAPR